ncbi:MAG: hypothetical protein H7039_11155 [Bryobacteraceae bacterium]|nr:hypothetical protein [Bryobacteraceae bacterium]
MYEFTFYTFCHRDYFENLHKYRMGPTYVNLLQQLVPADWKISRSDVWVQANPADAKFIKQGFKIHLSSSVAGAELMMRRFIPICVEACTPFKIAGDPTLHLFLNSKRYTRGGAGKFATIYPADTASFLELLERLHEATTDLNGAYILSDSRYKTSKVVFFRYGGIQRMQELQLDGTRRMMIEGPDGVMVQDRRSPFFELPAWVENPLADQMPEVEDSTPGLLNRRYEVTEALNFTNTGGVYKAVDTRTGRDVVIKEARPHTVLWAGADHAVDAVTALTQEHDCLKQLQGLPFVPDLIEFYQEWEHTFLVTSFFEGVPLARLRALEEFILLTRVDDVEQVVRFSNIWKELCLRLLDAVDAMHARGVVLGDISPGNVLMNRETGEIMLIDFESAQIQSSAGELAGFGMNWFYPGFRRPERRNSSHLAFEDDYYGCGMVLYNLLCPIQTIFELDKAHPITRILDYFIDSGVPPEIREIICALLQASPDEARRIAHSWRPERLLTNQEQIVAAV